MYKSKNRDQFKNFFPPSTSSIPPSLSTQHHHHNLCLCVRERLMQSYYEKLIESLRDTPSFNNPATGSRTPAPLTSLSQDCPEVLKLIASETWTRSRNFALIWLILIRNQEGRHSPSEPPAALPSIAKNENINPPSNPIKASPNRRRAARIKPGLAGDRLDALAPVYFPELLRPHRQSQL